MFNRFPDQAAPRRALALLGAVFLAFGAVTAWWAAPLLAMLGFLAGGVLLFPALLFGHSAFAKTEKRLSSIFAGW
jgi:hypothetical protein